jgi:AraC-like DNA-binding protein
MSNTSAIPSGFVSSLVINELIRWGRTQGLDVEAIMASANLSFDILQAPSALLDANIVETRLLPVLASLDDPLIGLHLAPTINVSTLGVIGFMMQTSSTLDDLIQSIIRFGNLVSDIGIPALHHEPGRAIWTWDCKFNSALAIRHTTECVLGCWAGLLRLRQHDRNASLLAVHFRHDLPAPELEQEYQRFFGCPVRFNQPESGLVLPSRSLGEPLALADPNLYQMLTLHAEQQLQAQQQHLSLADKVRGQLRTLLMQNITPARDDVARMLGMSGRNLHRKLDESGLSFRDLLDEVRLDIARTLLHTSTASITLISEQLGFTESQSFIRWFKKLEKMTPGEFRAHKPLPPPSE